MYLRDTGGVEVQFNAFQTLYFIVVSGQLLLIAALDPEEGPSSPIG
jgi:hypothetical protein